MRGEERRRWEYCRLVSAVSVIVVRMLTHGGSVARKQGGETAPCGHGSEEGGGGMTGADILGVLK
jgi:hypothetical protein